MGKAQETITVNAPIQECYEQWMRFEEFPRFMTHIREIRRQGGNRWHWIVDGPMGAPVEWDAVMDGQAQDRIISWHTEENSTVNNQGNVRFDQAGPNATTISAIIQYDPPAGAIGEAVANMFSNPEHMVQDSLQNFKQMMESKTSARISAGITG